MSVEGKSATITPHALLCKGTPKSALKQVQVKKEWCLFLVKEKELKVKKNHLHSLFLGNKILNMSIDFWLKKTIQHLNNNYQI